MDQRLIAKCHEENIERNDESRTELGISAVQSVVMEGKNRKFQE